MIQHFLDLVREVLGVLVLMLFGKPNFTVFFVENTIEREKIRRRLLFEANLEVEDPQHKDPCGLQKCVQSPH
jgi:hypothetical protein